MRAGINVLLLSFRTYRRRRLEFKLLWHAIFGTECFRFGAMIGASRVYLRQAHSSKAHSPSSTRLHSICSALHHRSPISAVVFGLDYSPKQHLVLRSGREMKASVAGKPQPLVLLQAWVYCGKPSPAGQVSHNSTSSRFSDTKLMCGRMFVRGLQGSYNLYTPRFGIHIPHGDILLFGACCGQIMYAWLCSPETIPKEYNDWYAVSVQC